MIQVQRVGHALINTSDRSALLRCRLFLSLFFHLFQAAAL